MDSARASLATACDDEGGMLCSMAEESSGVSWELIEGVLRRLQEEKGEDIMATDIDSQISGRDYIGHCDRKTSSRANARHCVNTPPDEIFR